MPDKWEYPWFAAWDLAFHMLPSLISTRPSRSSNWSCFCANGTCTRTARFRLTNLPFADVNPPVHAWSAWRVYKISAPRGSRDINFLESVFHKLLLNFTWWVNRKDTEGNNIFSGRLSRPG